VHILVIGNFYAEAFALHIAQTLTDMGHHVQRFEPGLRLPQCGGVRHRLNQVRGLMHAVSDKLPPVRAVRMRRLWRAVERTKCDLVLLCHDFLLPAEVAELKQRTGAKVALWFPDAVVNLMPGYCLNAPYDALFFKDPFIVHALKGTVRSPTFYLPECFNPAQHAMPTRVLPESEYACDVATAGSMHAWRVLVFSHLTEFDVKIWGMPPPLWMPHSTTHRMYQGRPVHNSEKAKAFLGAKVVVNSLHYGEVWGVNARAFEAAGIGAFQLIEWRPGLPQLFDDGRELVSYRGARDLKDKIRYWLPRDRERAAIAVAGMRRAHAEHTYWHRMTVLLDSLHGTGDGYPLPSGCT
jgi:spore maturation protein CgeB